MKQPSKSRQLRSRRRRGQALLLAVLVMIFAALLGAAFIAVVSINLNQTARQKDKTVAEQAAKAGIAYVNDRLTNSPEGGKWFQKTYEDSGALAAVKDDPIYYSPTDRAQGWAGNFVKFPDPNNPTIGPKFLARVDQIDYTKDPTSSDPDHDKAGMLKITVIGLSEDDPTAYDKIVAYKGGIDGAPIGQVPRTVSNTDFDSGFVPGGIVSAYAASTVSLTGTKGQFPSAPFYITIGPTATTAVRHALVSAVTTTTTGTDLTLADVTNLTASPPAAGEPVEVAAGIGIPPKIDYYREGTAATVIPTATLDDSAGNAGAQVNGGLVWFGNLDALTLNPMATSYGTGLAVPGMIRCSGVMDLETAANINFKGGSVASSTALVSSSTTGFPGAANAFDVVDDAYNRILGNTGETTRQVKSFHPPIFSSGAGLDRYLMLSKYSKPNQNAVVPALSTTPSVEAPAYGLGEGIYVDNYQDKEKYYNSTSGVREEMTREQLFDMLYKQTDTTESYERKGTAKDPNATADANRSKYSLEDCHLRGWIADDEFLPRGAEVELTTEGGIPYIYVTRDSRADNADDDNHRTESSGASDSKAWKDQTGATEAGIYTRKYNWPANGMLFAEGNVRIRGVAQLPNTDYKSLTVVSMNNIYIEGSLRLETADSQKILLMAKNNVIVNPTEIVGRPDEQTKPNPVTTTSYTFTAGASNTLVVEDVANFKVGDVLEMYGEDAGNHVESVGGLVSVSAIDTSTNTLTLTSISDTGAWTTSNLRLRHYRDTPVGSALSTIDQSATATKPAVQRRWYLDPAVTDTVYMNMVHGATQVQAGTASTVAVVLPKPTGQHVYLSNKMPRLGTTPTSLDKSLYTIPPAMKQMWASFTFPTTNEEKWKNPVPTDDASADAYTLAQLKSDMEGMSPHADVANAWNYSVTLNGTFNAVPAHYLAGFGSRYLYGAGNQVNTSYSEFRPDIMDSTFNLLMGTSIQSVDNATSTGQGIIKDLEGHQTMTLGFDPKFTGTQLPGVTPTAFSEEDVVTSDQSFYDQNEKAGTFDCRLLSANTPGQNQLVLRQSGGLTGITSTAALPAYHVAGIQPQDISVTGTDVSLKPLPMDIHAFVYAEQGSWFVIPSPTPDFIPNLKGDADKAYLDYSASGSPNGTADPGEYFDSDNSGSFTTGDYPDLNRNGVLEPEEVYAIQRYFRPNYQITMTGAIAENLSAPVLTQGTVPGAVESWTDATTPTTVDTTAATKVRVDRIKYVFDPDLVQGKLQGDDYFYLPQTPDLNYQS